MGECLNPIDFITHVDLWKKHKCCVFFAFEQVRRAGSPRDEELRFMPLYIRSRSDKVILNGKKLIESEKVNDICTGGSIVAVHGASRGSKCVTTNRGERHL